MDTWNSIILIFALSLLLLLCYLPRRSKIKQDSVEVEISNHVITPMMHEYNEAIYEMQTEINERMWELYLDRMARLNDLKYEPIGEQEKTLDIESLQAPKVITK